MTKIITGYDRVIDTRTKKQTSAPILRDLDEVRAEYASRLQSEVREHVRANYSEDDEATVNNLDALLTSKALLGATMSESERTVMGLIAQARMWVVGATAVAGDMLAAVGAATTLEELDAITVDLKAIGEPPAISGGKIAKMLRDK